MNKFQAQQAERQNYLGDEAIGHGQSALIQMQSRQQRLLQPPSTPSRQNTQQSFMMQSGRQAASLSARQSALPIRPPVSGPQLAAVHKQSTQGLPPSPIQKMQAQPQQQKMQVKQAQKSAAQASSVSQEAVQKPTQTQSVAEQQVEVTEQDSSLDAEVLKMKLQRGSEQLLQWSVQQEYAVADLKKKLDESLEVRERLKKNMLDMQMQMEQNSQKYQVEKQVQETLLEKVQNTRGIYSILYEHFQKVNESLENCYKVKEEIIQNHQSLKEYIETLREPLERAEALCQKQVKAMEELVEMREEVHKAELKKANAVSCDLEQKLQEARHLLSIKSETCLELENKLSLASKSAHVITCENEKAISELQQELKIALNSIKEKEVVIRNKDLKIENVISQMKSLEQEINNVKLSYKKACCENSVLQNNLEYHKAEAEKLEGHKNMLAKQLENSKNDFKNLESENQALNVKLQDYSNIQKSIENELADVQHQLAEKSSELESVLSRYQVETEELKSLVVFHKEKYEKIEADLHEVEVMDTELQRILCDKDKTITDLTSQLQLLATEKAENASKVSKLTADKSLLQSRLSDAENLFAKEAEHKALLVKELAAANANEQKLEERINQLQLDVESKCCLIENEWKGKMSSETQRIVKEMKEAEEKLRAQLDQSLKLEVEKYAKWQAEFSSDMQKRIDEFKKESNEFAEMKARLEKEVAEKDDTYKVVIEEKNVLVIEINEKEEQVSKLQEALNALEKNKEEVVVTLTKEREEVEAKRLNDLKALMTEFDENILKLNSDISENMKTITRMENNLKTKDNYIDDLKAKLRSAENALKEVTFKKETIKNTKDIPRSTSILKSNTAIQDKVEIPNFESPLRTVNKENSPWKKVAFDVSDESDVSSIDFPLPLENKKNKNVPSRIFSTETNKATLIFGKPKKPEQLRDPLGVFEDPPTKKTSSWKLSTTGSKRKSQAEENVPTQQSKSKSRGNKFFKGREKKSDEGTIDFGCLNFDDL